MDGMVLEKKPGTPLADLMMSESEAATPQGDFSKLWSQLVAKAWADEKLRERLLSDPMTVMEEHGLCVPPGIQVKIVQNTAGVIHLPLPPKPTPAEISEEDLSQAVTGARPIGGACGNDTCSVSYFPIRSQAPRP
jgi:hypothetical protein